MSDRTDRPKRAWLSLRSMGVLCVVLAFLSWANTVARSPDARIRRRGVPVAYEAWIDRCDVPLGAVDQFVEDLDTLDMWKSTGLKITVNDSHIIYPASRNKSLSGDSNAHSLEGVVCHFEATRKLDWAILLIDLAVALSVSIAIALASERFLFGKLRRPHENGGRTK